MAVLGMLIFIMVVIVVGFLVFGGVSHEIKKINDKEVKRNMLYSQLVNDFNHLDITSYEYSLPLSVIVSKLSILYAKSDRGQVPSKLEWEQYVFSICKLAVQLKDIKLAKEFYDEFVRYKEYRFQHKQTQQIHWDSNKLVFERFLSDLHFFARSQH